jgi:hypothetical protein
MGLEDVFLSARPIVESLARSTMPSSTVRQRREIEDLFDVGPGHHMPAICPSCHAVNTSIFIEHDPDEMSEGQLTDYEAGMFGTSYCEACEVEFDWGF